jgi:hypothetical protein
MQSYARRLMRQPPQRQPLYRSLGAPLVRSPAALWRFGLPLSPDSREAPPRE